MSFDQNKKHPTCSERWELLSYTGWIAGLSPLSYEMFQINKFYIGLVLSTKIYLQKLFSLAFALANLLTLDDCRQLAPD